MSNSETIAKWPSEQTDGKEIWDGLSALRIKAWDPRDKGAMHSYLLAVDKVEDWPPDRVLPTKSGEHITTQLLIGHEFFSASFGEWGNHHAILFNLRPTDKHARWLPEWEEATRPRSTAVALTEASLRLHVGEWITVSGFWSPLGKESGYVYGVDKSIGPSVYVKATDEQGLPRQTAFENTIKDGALVEVTGVLRRFESALPPTSDPVAVQRQPDHFYFDAADTSIKVIVR